MANQPHPSKTAVTWRLPGVLVAAVKAAAKANDETMLAFATRALERELRAALAAGETESEAPSRRGWIYEDFEYGGVTESEAK